MSEFLNNTEKVAPLAVRIPGLDGVNEAETHSDLIAVVKVVVGTAELLAAEAKQFEISQLTGGLSNILYLIREKVSGFRAIVRVFGAGTSDYIDREVENVVFSKLSKNNLGPTFYGLFGNGRVEGYLDAVNLEASDMSADGIYPLIAASVARLHYMDISEIREPAADQDFVWQKTEQFFALASRVEFDTGSPKQRALEQVNLSAMRREYEWLKGHMQSLKAEVCGRRKLCGDATDESHRNAGRAYALEDVLCHNDLLSGNIMLSRSYPQSASSASIGTATAEDIIAIAVANMTLIDYEYAAYNFRGFDIANHFVEHCSVELAIPPPGRTFPDREFRIRFIRAYLQIAATMDENLRFNDKFIEGVEEVVCQFLLVVHMFWGTWSVVQSGSATIEFDYLEYAQLRNAAFAWQKQEFSTLLADEN